VVLLVVSLTLGIGASCRVDRVPATAPALPVTRVRTDRTAIDEASPLRAAVDRYHETGDLTALQAWLQQHPDDPEAAIWREVVALRDYEDRSYGEWSAIDDPDLSGWGGPDDAVEYAADGPPDAGLPERDEAVLRELARRHRGTMVGDTAVAVLDQVRVRSLLQLAVSRRVTDLLDGRVDWAEPGQTPDEAARADFVAFRGRHAPALRQQLADALVADACWTTMGYCTWWIDRYPDDPVTATLGEAQRAVWYRRAHPTWKGNNHTYCAHKCVDACRPQATPLDDACFEPCYLRCPEAELSAVARPAG
jgi:hypothetical protein